MINPASLEQSFQELMNSLDSAVPDGIIQVNLHLLRNLGLLNSLDQAFTCAEHTLNHYFHVIETPEKITLFNDRFAVWIVPLVFDDETATFTLISILRDDQPNLELVFSASGVYNSSKIVLRILERFLEEIQENERLVSDLSRVC